MLRLVVPYEVYHCCLSHQIANPCNQCQGLCFHKSYTATWDFASLPMFSTSLTLSIDLQPATTVKLCWDFWFISAFFSIAAYDTTLLPPAASAKSSVVPKGSTSSAAWDTASLHHSTTAEPMETCSSTKVNDHCCFPYSITFFYPHCQAMLKLVVPQ